MFRGVILVFFSCWFPVCNSLSDNVTNFYSLATPSSPRRVKRSCHRAPLHFLLWRHIKSFLSFIYHPFINLVCFSQVYALPSTSLCLSFCPFLSYMEFDTYSWCGGGWLSPSPKTDLPASAPRASIFVRAAFRIVFIPKSELWNYVTAHC